MRLSDFKSNEYSNLLGGERYEPHEENPMLGFRGASRYVAPEFYDCFALECEAMKRVRDVMGFTNVELMIPFVRTLTEAEQVLALLAKNGLARGANGLRVIMMCEMPSNAILAERFLEHFDGFSIGSNDMTQLTLGVDRDSGGAIASTFDERDDAVKAMLALAIKACQKRASTSASAGRGRPTTPISRSGWSTQGIESMSLNPDTVVETWLALAKQRTDVGSGWRPARRPNGRWRQRARRACNARMRLPPHPCTCRSDLRASAGAAIGVATLATLVVVLRLPLDRRGSMPRSAPSCSRRAWVAFAAARRCATPDAVVRAAARAESARRRARAVMAGSWPATCDPRRACALR